MVIELLKHSHFLTIFEVRIANTEWQLSTLKRRTKNLTLIYAKDVFLSHSETKNYSNFLKENKTASDASSRLFLHLKGSSLFLFLSISYKILITTDLGYALTWIQIFYFLGFLDPTVRRYIQESDVWKIKSQELGPYLGVIL